MLISRARGGRKFINGQFAEFLTAQSIIPKHDSLDQTGVSPDPQVLGHPHICSQNFINDPAVQKTVESEGGAGVTSILSGQVVNPHVTPNTRQVGDYPTILVDTHGGIHNSPNAITCKPGTSRIPADNDDDEEITQEVP